MLYPTQEMAVQVVSLRFPRQLARSVSQILNHDSRHHNPTSGGASYHGNFSSGNRTAGRNRTSGRGFLLVQHVLELLLGIALESYELESVSIPLLPTDNGKGNDN